MLISRASKGFTTLTNWSVSIGEGRMNEAPLPRPRPRPRLPPRPRTVPRPRPRKVPRFLPRPRFTRGRRDVWNNLTENQRGFRLTCSISERNGSVDFRRVLSVVLALQVGDSRDKDKEDCPFSDCVSGLYRTKVIARRHASSLHYSDEIPRGGAHY